WCHTQTPLAGNRPEGPTGALIPVLPPWLRRWLHVYVGPARRNDAQFGTVDVNAPMGHRIPPNCGQPKKERANLRHRQTIFGTAPLMRKNGWSAFAVKSRRHSLKQRSSNNAACGRVSETGAFSAFGFDYRRKRSVLIIVVIVGVWTVSVPDCPSGGA